MRNNRDRKLTDTLNVRIPHALKMSLKEKSNKKGITLSTYILEVLEQSIK